MPDTWLLRASVRLITALSALAPEWRRDDWRNEWLGELHFRASRLAAHRRLTAMAQLRCLTRCAGAALHLLWLWSHEWGFDTLTQDVRYGLRLLKRRPAFSLVAVTTLAFGIGATTAIFSAVRTVLLDALPYREPSRLVRMYGVDAREGQETVGNLSVPDIADLQRLATSFAAVGAHNHGGYFTLTGSGEPERVPRLLVTSGYFRVLEAQPAAGRLFRSDEDRPTPPDVVVISHGFWQRRFGGDPGVIGRTVTLGGGPAAIVGVLQSGFVHPDPKIESAPDVFALLDPDENMSSRSGRYVRAIGRLEAGVSLEQASSEIRMLASNLAKQFPDSNAGRSVRLSPLADAVAGDLRTPLVLLQAATVAILLIACVNLANLLLGAAIGRDRRALRPRRPGRGPPPHRPATVDGESRPGRRRRAGRAGRGGVRHVVPGGGCGADAAPASTDRDRPGRARVRDDRLDRGGCDVRAPAGALHLTRRLRAGDARGATPH